MKNVSNQGSLPRLKLDDSVTSWQDKVDYLELKPNVFGLGFDLNKIIKDLFAFYQRRKKK
jgi:hypothetical protein